MWIYEGDECLLAYCWISDSITFFLSLLFFGCAGIRYLAAHTLYMAIPFGSNKNWLKTTFIFVFFLRLPG